MPKRKSYYKHKGTRRCAVRYRKKNKIGHKYCPRYQGYTYPKGSRSRMKKAWANAHAAGRKQLIKGDFK